MNSPVFGSKLGERIVRHAAFIGRYQAPVWRGLLVWIRESDGPAYRYPLRPVHGAERYGEQALAVGTVEDEEVTVARRLHQHLARLAVKVAVNQHWNFDGIPVVRVMRRGLKCPGEFAGIWIERHDAARIEIVAGAVVAVQHRSWIASSPVRSDSGRDHKCRSSRSAAGGRVRRAGRRGCVPLPLDLPGIGIEGLHEAADVVEVAGDARRSRDCALPAAPWSSSSPSDIGDFDIPSDFAGLRIEANQVRIGSR